MATSKDNDVKNVSVGKGITGGYFYSAPLGTTMPTKAGEKPGEGFINLGYISEDGVVFSTETDSEDIPDMNGDTIVTSTTSHSENMTLTLAENKAATMGEMYGIKNVTDESGLMTVHVKGDETEHRCGVFLFLLKDGRKWTRLVHDYQLKELGELTVASSELAARESTFTVFKDAKTGDYYTDLIDSTETTGMA